MRKLYASLILAAAIAPTVGFAADASVIDKDLKIVSRYEAGTIEGDVEMSQGKVGLEVQLKGATPQQTAILVAAFQNKVQRNMKELGKFVTCVKTPANCKVESPK